MAKQPLGDVVVLLPHSKLLRGNQEGLRAATKPLFAVLVELVGRARPSADDATVVAGALWANLHGLAQLWLWGSLQMTVDTDDPGPLLCAVVDSYVER